MADLTIPENLYAPDSRVDNSVQVRPLFDVPAPGEAPKAPLFDAPADAPQQNLNSDTQVKMTSTLAAYATQMNASSDDTMSALQQQNEYKIKTGKEEELRAQVGEQYRNQQVQTLQQLQTNAMKLNPADYTLKDALNAEQDVQHGPVNSSAIEETGTKVMQVAQPNPDQAALSAYLSGGRNVQSDHAAKLAIFNSKLDRLKTEAENENPLEKFADIVGEVTGLEGIAGSLVPKGTSAFKLPSTNINETSNQLWSSSPQSFGSSLDDIIARGKDRMGAAATYRLVHQFGGANIGLAGQSALSYNFWTIAPPASFIPVLKMAKYASGLARVVGNRGLSTNIAAAGIASKSLGVPSGLEHIQPIEASIAETIPSVSIPDTVSLARGDVGMISDVADRLTALQKATEGVRATMQKTPRLEPPQIKEAIQKAVKTAEMTYRDSPIADIKREDPVPVDIKASDTEPFPVTEKSEPAGPAKTKEFVGVSSKGKPVPKPYAPSAEEIAEMDPDSLAMLNDHGELRPVKSEGAPPKQGRPGRLKSTGQSKMSFEVDDDTDVDTLSHFNARGEIYHDVPDDKTFRTNPFTIQQEHDLEVARLEREGAEAAVPKPPVPETGNVGGIRSIPQVIKSPSTGLYSLSFYLGKDQTTGGFLTRDGAAAAAERRGIANADLHQTLSGEWYIKATHVIPETGLVTKVVRPQDFPAVYRPSEFVKSLDGLMPMLHNEARKGAVVGRSRWLAEIVNPYAKNIKRLNGAETNLLSSVLKAGEGERKWYSSGELFDKYQQLAGRLPTEKEQMAYYSSKEISDTVYHVLNDKLFTAKARRGVITGTVTNPEIGLDTGRVNMQIVHPDEARGQHIFVADDGSISDGVRKDVQLLIDTGHYKMIKLEKAILQEKKNVKFILSHDDSLKTEPLERQQLEYSAGGSREYADKWFSKQANYVDDDEGRRTWLDPLTHVTGDYKSISKWNDDMEEARQVYNSNMSETEKRLRLDRSPIESYDKFDEMVKDGRIHPGTPFETLFDKADPAAMKRIGLNDKNLTDPALAGEEGYYMTQARMYYGEKGERMQNPSGALAKTLDPLATLRRAVVMASKTAALGDYSTKVIEDWARAASPYIDFGTVSDQAEPWDIFFNGKFLDKGLSPEEQRLVSGMDIARNAHKRFMNMRDPDQNLRSMYLKNLAIKLETKGVIPGNWAQAIYNRLSNDPVSAVRDLVFQGYFGFLNLGRFVLHASQAVGAIAYDPARGLTAAGMAPLTAAAVWINRSDKLLDYIARKMGPDLGMPVQDYKEMVKSLRYSGWLHVGGEVAQLDRYSDKWGGTALSKTWDVTKKVGVVPFHAAIATQRLMAYHMAWSMAKELMPEVDVWSSAFQGFVNNKADALSGNMTTASSAAWQKGGWSIPTQFMSWQARMMENLLPETFGGSKAISGKQKLQYAVGQALLWGGAGLPVLGAGVDWLSEMYRDNTGQQISADTHRAITKGIVDSVIHGFTGADTDLASRAGFGDALNKSILNPFANGTQNPFLQMLGGPVVETGNVLLDKVGHFVTYMKAEQSDDISADQFAMAFRDALPLIQGFKYDQKAYWAWKYKNIFDQKTGQPILQNGTTTSDIVTQALGIPNVWETDKNYYFQKQDEREQTIKDVAQQIAKVRREEFDAIQKGDQPRMNHMSNIVRVLMQPYRDQPLMSQQIAKQATEYMTKGYTGSQQEQIINREYKNTGYIPAEANQ